MGGGGQPAATPLPSAQDVGPQLDPESVDAALRVVEELAACDVGQAALEAQPGVLDAMVGLLGADPSPQVRGFMMPAASSADGCEGAHVPDTSHQACAMPCVWSQQKDGDAHEWCMSCHT